MGPSCLVSIRLSLESCCDRIESELAGRFLATIDSEGFNSNEKDPANSVVRTVSAMEWG